MDWFFSNNIFIARLSKPQWAPRPGEGHEHLGQPCKNLFKFFYYCWFSPRFFPFFVVTLAEWTFAVIFVKPVCNSLYQYKLVTTNISCVEKHFFVQNNQAWSWFYLSVHNYGLPPFARLERWQFQNYFDVTDSDLFNYLMNSASWSRRQMSMP
jgi:hypothetical protein